MGAEEKEFWDSPGVQAHLTIMQSIIGRMAGNSTSCKAWCIALVSALVVLMAEQKTPNMAAVAVIPVLLFFFLDTYYLSLEKRFRKGYNTFIEKLHKRQIAAEDLYIIHPKGDAVETFLMSLLSPSIWPFYATLAVAVFIAQLILVHNIPTNPLP